MLSDPPSRDFDAAEAIRASRAERDSELEEWRQRIDKELQGDDDVVIDATVVIEWLLRTSRPSDSTPSSRAPTGSRPRSSMPRCSITFVDGNDFNGCQRSGPWPWFGGS